MKAQLTLIPVWDVDRVLSIQIAKLCDMQLDITMEKDGVSQTFCRNPTL